MHGSNNFEPLPIKFSDDKSPWAWKDEDDQRAETAFGLALTEDRVEPWVMTYGGTPVVETPVDPGASSCAPTQFQTAFGAHAAEGQAGPPSWTLDCVRAQILTAFTAAIAVIKVSPTRHGQALNMVPSMAAPAFTGNGAETIRSSYDMPTISMEGLQSLDEDIVEDLPDYEDEIGDVDMADSFEGDWASSSPSSSSMFTSLSGHTPTLTASSSLTEGPLSLPTPPFNSAGNEEFRCRWNGGWNDGTCNHKLFSRKEQNSDWMSHFLNYHQESTDLENGRIRCLWCRKRPLISRLGIANHIRTTQGHQLDMEENWID